MQGVRYLPEGICPRVTYQLQKGDNFPIEISQMFSFPSGNFPKVK